MDLIIKRLERSDAQNIGVLKYAKGEKNMKINLKIYLFTVYLTNIL